VSRDVRLYLEDIVSACEKIGRFTHGMTQESFVADERTYDAVLRNLEVLGEAAKRVPDATRQEMPEVPWRAIAGFRDFVAHVYFALDDAIVWSAVQDEVPKLCQSVARFLDRHGSSGV
jgi:uncharacterized protein with HEPN domain